MPHLALVTSEALPELDPDSQLLPPALEAAGATLTIAAWSDPRVDWSAFDAVVVRSTWDYFDHPEAFADWLDRVEREARAVFNPPSVLRWNAHKSYLRDLESRGVRILETQWVQAGETATVEFDEAV